MGPRLLGRTARVEDELAFQRELICTRFEAVDKRFEEMLHRFDAVDKRFEDMHRSMETRFQAVDKRFEDLHRSMDKHLGVGLKLTNQAARPYTESTSSGTETSAR